MATSQLTFHNNFKVYQRSPTTATMLKYIATSLLFISPNYRKICRATWSIEISVENTLLTVSRPIHDHEGCLYCHQRDERGCTRFGTADWLLSAAWKKTENSQTSAISHQFYDIRIWAQELEKKAVLLWETNTVRTLFTLINKNSQLLNKSQTVSQGN